MCFWFCYDEIQFLWVRLVEIVLWAQILSLNVQILSSDCNFAQNQKSVLIDHLLFTSEKLFWCFFSQSVLDLFCWRKKRFIARNHNCVFKLLDFWWILNLHAQITELVLFKSLCEIFFFYSIFLVWDPGWSFIWKSDSILTKC